MLRRWLIAVLAGGITVAGGMVMAAPAQAVVEISSYTSSSLTFAIDGPDSMSASGNSSELVLTGVKQPTPPAVLPPNCTAAGQEMQCSGITTITIDGSDSSGTQTQTVILGDLDITSATVDLGGGVDDLTVDGTFTTQLDYGTSGASGTANTLNFTGVTGGISQPITADTGGASTVEFNGMTGQIAAPITVTASDLAGQQDNIDFANLTLDANTPLTVNTGEGNDTVNLSGLTDEGSSNITVGTGDGTDNVELDNASIGASSTVAVTTGNGPGAVDLASTTFASGDTVTIDTGTGGDTVQLATTQLGVSVQMGSGSATNTLDLSSDPTGDTFLYTSPTVISSGGGASFTGVDTFDATAGNDIVETTYDSQTINAGGGDNTINYSGDTQNLDINLTAGTAVATAGANTYTSQIPGFENAIGGSGVNTVEGRAGGGNLDGGSGTGNTVSFAFEPPADGVTIDLMGHEASAPNGTWSIVDFASATGGAGANTLIPGLQQGTFDGGTGDDNTVSFADEPAGNGVDVDFASTPIQATMPNKVVDTLENIQGFIGGAGNDTVQMPSSGVLTGPIQFGSGENTIDFSADPTGATFSFPESTTVSVLGQTIANVAKVIGTAGNNTFDAEGTLDTLDGGPGGDNTISYASDSSAVQVNLGTGTAVTSAGTTQISDFQNVIGGDGNDTLTGGSGSGELIGGSGQDTIDPGTGNYYINAETGDDLIDAGTGHNVIVGEGGEDTVSFAGQSANVTIDLTGAADSGTSGQDEVISGINNAVGGSGQNTFIGNAQNDILEGGSGQNTFEPGTADDTIEGGGGPGANIVSFANTPASDQVTVDLATDSATNGNATDRLVSIQEAILGAGPDTLIGGAGPETLVGGSGDDTIYGGSGQDTITTGNGTDDVDAGTGADTITTGTGSDLVNVRNGIADTVTCGGNDTVLAAAIDTINNCSTVVLPAPTLGGNTPITTTTTTSAPPPVTYATISATLSTSFSAAKKKGYTRVRRLQLSKVGANTSIVALCDSTKFSACPFRRSAEVITTQTATYSLLGLFGDVPVASGVKFELELAEPGAISRFYTFTFRKGNTPKESIQCQIPGGAVGAC